MVGCLALPDSLHRIFDGKHVAILEREGDQPGAAASLPVSSGDRCGGRINRAVFGVCVDCCGAGISGVGGSGAFGVLVGTEEAAGGCAELKV